MFLLAGRVLEKRKAAPTPLLRVSLSVSRKGPSMSQSGPSPPATRSESGPLSTNSLPSSPPMRSEPPPPRKSSLPEPPNTLSEPSRADDPRQDGRSRRLVVEGGFDEPELQQPRRQLGDRPRRRRDRLCFSDGAVVRGRPRQHKGGPPGPYCAR